MKSLASFYLAVTVLSATLIPSDAQAQLKFIKHQASKRAAGNGYIVHLRPQELKGAQALEGKVKKLLTKYKGKKKGVFKKLFKGYVVEELTEAQAKKLSADPSVAFVEENLRVELAEVTYPVHTPAPDVRYLWNLDRVDQRSATLDTRYTSSLTGAGVHVYVVDTGITPHAEFEDRLLPGVTLVNDSNGTTDCINHGTRVAGVVAGKTVGVAKRALVHSVKMFTCEPTSGTLSNVLRAFEWIMANKVDPAVINLSISATPSPSMVSAVKTAIAAGITVVHAAGNDNRNWCDPSLPGYDDRFTQFAGTNMLIVGSIGTSGGVDAKSAHSNYGSCVDLYAPGEGIHSSATWPHNGYGSAYGVNGTSFAAPHVSGTAALYLAANPGAKPAEVRAKIIANATKGTIAKLDASSNHLVLYSKFSDSQTPNACSRIAPSVAITSASAAPVDPGEEVGMKVSVKNNNSSTCPPELFQLSTETLPANWDLDFDANEVDLDSGESNTISFTVRSLTSTPDGTYKFKLSAKSASAPVISGFGEGQVQILKEVITSGGSDAGGTATGGTATGGTVTGGTATGGTATGGTSTGGTATGGTAGGTVSGGTAAGTATGGTATGGTATGGTATGGTTTGGETTGGSATGGSDGSSATGGSSTGGSDTGTTTGGQTGRMNVALKSNGAVAKASSEIPGLVADLVIDGHKTWAVATGWKDGTPNSFPDLVEVQFNGLKDISEIVVIGVRDDYQNSEEPSDSLVSTLFGLQSFRVKYWNGSAWALVPNGEITSNDKVVNRFRLATPVRTTKIQVEVLGGAGGYSRIVELEAWEGSEGSSTGGSTTGGMTGENKNFALRSNGAVAKASSEIPGLVADLVIDGHKTWAVATGWKDGTANSFPDLVEVQFNGLKDISEIAVIGVRDDYQNSEEPSDSLVSTLYGLQSFRVKYWNGSSWALVPNGEITSNDKVVNRFRLATPVRTTKIQVEVLSGAGGYSRIVELEAWGK